MNKLIRKIETGLAILLIVCMVFQTIGFGTYAEGNEGSNEAVSKTETVERSPESNGETKNISTTVVETENKPTDPADTKQPAESEKTEGNVSAEKASVENTPADVKESSPESVANAKASPEATAEEPAAENPVVDDAINMAKLTAKVAVNSTDAKNSGTELTEEGISLSAPYNAKFTLHIDVTFPFGTDKKIEVSLPFGMAFASDYLGQDNLKSPWYASEVKKLVSPYSQKDPTKKPMNAEFGGSLRNGTFTLEFNDAIERASFDMPIYTQFSVPYGFLTNIHNLQDAIKVTQSFTSQKGNPVSQERKVSELQLTGYKDKVTIQMSNINSYLNENKHIPVPVGGTSGNSAEYRVADETGDWLSSKLLDDYYITFEAPEGTKLKGLNAFFGDWLGATLQVPTITKAGEHFRTSKGQDYVVPSGKMLFTFRSRGMLITATNLGDSRSKISPIWSFEDEDKFPNGTIAEIKMLDVGVKYLTVTEQQNYLPYDDKALPSVTYEILKGKEEIFANVAYDAKNGKVYQREGTIGDYRNIKAGAPGQETIQERWLGQFLLGNRGLADSQPKLVTFNYDTENKDFMGVTGLFLPRNSSVQFVTDTELKDLKVKLWNKKTGEVSDWIAYDKGSIPDEIVITDFSSDKDVYFKEVQYQLNTIPKQTYFGDGGSKNKVVFKFYGKSTETLKKGESSVAKSTITIANLDGSDSVTGTNLTTFIGGIPMPEVKKSYGNEGDRTVVAGDTKRFTFSLIGPGSEGSAGIVNKIWLISPNGSDFDVKTFKVAKIFYNTANLYPDRPDIHNWDRIDISDYVKPSEVTASKELKEKYPNAKVYELDFTKIDESDPLKFFTARVIGPQFTTFRRADGVRPSSWGAYWFTNGAIELSADYHSDSNEEPLLGKDRPEILWAEIKSTKDAEYTSAYTDDIYNLANKPGIKLYSNNKLEVTQTKSLVVQTGNKETDSKDPYQSYHPSNVESALSIDSYHEGPNSFDYKIRIKKTNLEPVKAVDLYVPVPKKNITFTSAKPLLENKEDSPKVNMFFRGMHGTLPEGFEIKYLVKTENADPTKIVTYNVQSSDKQAGFEWKNENEIKEGNYDNVVLINIHSLKPIENNVAYDFMFQYAIDKDAEAGVNYIWTPQFKETLEAYSAWQVGQPVAAKLQAKTIKGFVWNDLNGNGLFDEGENPWPDITVVLHRKALSQNKDDANQQTAPVTSKAPRGTEEGATKDLIITVKTDKDGNYVFENLNGFYEYEVEVVAPDEDTMITNSGKDNHVEEKYKTDDGKSVGKTEDLRYIPKEFTKTVNAGLVRALVINVKKEWVDTKGQQYAYFDIQIGKGETWKQYDKVVFEYDYNAKDKKDLWKAAKEKPFKIDTNDKNPVKLLVPYLLNEDYRIVETDEDGKVADEKIELGKQKYTVSIKSEKVTNEVEEGKDKKEEVKDKVEEEKDQKERGKSKYEMNVTITNKLVKPSSSSSGYTPGNNNVYFHFEDPLYQDVVIGVVSGDKLSGNQIPIPVKTGFKFVGWYYKVGGLENDEVKPFDINQPIYGDIHLYPKWEKLPLVIPQYEEKKSVPNTADYQ